MGRKAKELPTPPEVKDLVQDFKRRLIDTASRPDETSAFDAETVRIIMEELNDTERAILFVCYGACDGSTYQASKIFKTSNSVIVYRLKKIMKYITEHNDIPRTIYNLPRQCDID
jgi:hypothetical protein